MYLRHLGRRAYIAAFRTLKRIRSNCVIADAERIDEAELLPNCHFLCIRKESASGGRPLILVLGVVGRTFKSVVIVGMASAVVVFIGTVLRPEVPVGATTDSRLKTRSDFLAQAVPLAVVDRISGVFTYGFEIREFRRCGNPTVRFAIEGDDRILRSLAESLHKPIFGEVTGFTFGPGRYGVMDSYAYGIYIDSVLFAHEEIPSTFTSIDA